MSVIARAEGTVTGTPAQVFAKFIDFRNWRYFMPWQFRPVSGPERALRPGDRVRARLDVGPLRIVVPVDVFEVSSPAQIVWGGGNALLHARHVFRFEPTPAGTRIDSEETWTGALARVSPLGARVRRQAESVGRAQLDGFTRWMDAEAARAVR
ncbi:MAG: SRPBCC family protein [Polyangiaceae bacterium]|nr:SRPBCC family protein [Polyangiaceae bacterium]